MVRQSNTTNGSSRYWSWSLQSSITCLFQNWDHDHRLYPGKRLKGWTEIGNVLNETDENETMNEQTEGVDDLGMKPAKNNNNNSNAQDASGDDKWSCWKVEEMTTFDSIVTLEHIPLRLVQYRPAWMEQLAMRIANIEHIVVNYQYAVTEVTGPLPFLQDFSHNSAPVKMMGRNQVLLQPNHLSSDLLLKNTNSSAILNYLLEEYEAQFQTSLALFTKKDQRDDLEKNAKNIELLSQQYLLIRIIEDTLQPCWLYLRYMLHDNAGRDASNINSAWTAVYRPQSIAASTLLDGVPWLPFSTSFFASWQAWSERIHYSIKATSSFSSSQRIASFSDALVRIRSAYDVLEQQLKKNSNILACVEHRSSKISDANAIAVAATGTPRTFILGTNLPSVVDLLLFDHLMNALTDIHLLVVLADYPLICDYIQHVWNTYFDSTQDRDFIHLPLPSSSMASASNLSTNNNNGPLTWRQWNHFQNSTNPFNTIPISKRSIIGDEDIAVIPLYNDAAETGSRIVPTSPSVFVLQQEISILEGQYNLHEVLVAAKAAREKDNALGSRFRWSPNSYVSSSSKRIPAPTRPSNHFSEPCTNAQKQNNSNFNSDCNDSSDNNNSSMEKKREQQQRQLQLEYHQNDLAWITSVIIATLGIRVGIVLLSKITG